MLICIFSPACQIFGGVYDTFNYRQSSSTPGFSLQLINSSSRCRQTRPAIAQTARGRHPSVDDFRKLSTPNALLDFDKTWYPSSPRCPLQESIETSALSRLHHRDPRECVQQHHFDSLLEGSIISSAPTTSTRLQRFLRLPHTSAYPRQPSLHFRLDGYVR